MSLGTLKRLAREPLLLPFVAWSRLAPGSLFRRYATLTRRAGINRPLFVLSFDCDTPEDAQVVKTVHERVVGIGAKPVYAVPGSLLEAAADVYKCIADTGAEFMNHGYGKHVMWDPDAERHVSCGFYDQMSREQVREDVVKGDEAVREVLGVSPAGFRAPHFGTFQKKRQLSFLHTILGELDYDYSSSTIPMRGLRSGAAFNTLGLWEVPVSGMASSPCRILDSWNFFGKKERNVGPQDYSRESALLARRIELLGTGIINAYVDPSHIHENEGFFDAVRGWVACAMPVDYRLLVGELNRVRSRIGEAPDTALAGHKD